MIIKIPSEFLRRIRNPLGWADVKYAYETGIIDSKAVIAYACDLLASKEDQNEDVVKLACSRPSDSLASLLANLAADQSFSLEETSRRWALILAAFAIENESNDPLSVVEDIYSSFDYPSELAPFIRYMPMVGPDLGSVDANENRMKESLREFSQTVIVPIVETAGQ